MKNRLGVSVASIMKIQSRYARIVAFLLGAALFAFAGWASADPPTRVARLGYIAGDVSLSPAGESDWAQATMNLPLVTGDRLWADAGARAELQVGSAVVRLSGGTNLSVLDLADNTIQLQLTQGTVNLHVRRFAPDDVIEIDTPNLAFSVLQAGDYRIDVDSAGDATTVVTRSGSADVYGGDAAYAMDAPKSYRFFGTGLHDYDEFVDPLPDDDFDRWCAKRDHRWERSIAARYVSPDVIGYQDLDGNGMWRADARYGYVWIPNRVPLDWAPYHYGHWAWVEPWGWTWVDDAPWGFAVSHYGRWADLGGTWGWVPGPARARAVYAPALVVFVGGRDFQLSISSGNVGGIGWFPLGPREVYRPAYAVSRNYFTNINTSNTVINEIHITNVYNNTNVTNITYVNQRVPGAVVAVPATAFAQSQSVSKARVRIPKEKFFNAPAMPDAAVAPVHTSVMGAGKPADSKPPEAILERSVFAKRAPPGFARKEHLLANNPNRAIEETAPGVPGPAERVSKRIHILAPTQPARPIGTLPERRKKFEQRDQPSVPDAQPQAVPPPVAAPFAQRGKERRGKSVEQQLAPVEVPMEQRRKFERRDQLSVPDAQPQAVPPAPVAVPAEPRRRWEPRARPAEQPAPAVEAPAAQRRRFEPHMQPSASGAQTQMAPAMATDVAGKGEQQSKEPGTARNRRKKSEEPLKPEERKKLEEQQKLDEEAKKHQP
ncbi:MAG: hypothetical protein HY306_00150 [Nitrosomonadales bacterium]|nr:hypothetical protein [Nitrosomonadales bacterium]